MIQFGCQLFYKASKDEERLQDITAFLRRQLQMKGCDVDTEEVDNQYGVKMFEDEAQETSQRNES